VFQGAGYDVIRVQGVAYEGGNSLYKGSGFSLLVLFFIPSPHLYSSFYTLLSSSFNMASYAEDIIRMAQDATGPSIQDMEVIRSFQSRPAQKDMVSSFPFICFIVVILILSFLLEWDAYLFGSPSY
jgi:hypothetical protein